MPTTTQFRIIFRMNWEGHFAEEIGRSADCHTRTVEKALMFEREIDGGLDVETGVSRTGWKPRTLKAAKIALELEKQALSDRRSRLTKLAKDQARRCVVLLPREMLNPGPSWSGGGLKGGANGSTSFVYEKEPDWIILAESFSIYLKAVLEEHRTAVTALRRATVAFQNKQARHLLAELRGRELARDPDVAKEAILHSFLSWVAGSTASATHREYLEQFECERSGGVTTITNGAWRFDLKRVGEDGVTDTNTLIKAVEFSVRSVSSSESSRNFRTAYQAAVKSARKLKELLELHEP